MNDFIYNYIISTENEKIDVENNCFESNEDIKNRCEELVFDISIEIEKQIIKSKDSLSK
jgi:hypothetical protein